MAHAHDPLLEQRIFSAENKNKLIPFKSQRQDGYGVFSASEPKHGVQFDERFVYEEWREVFGLGAFVATATPIFKSYLIPPLKRRATFFHRCRGWMTA